jgi:hypothetical protein
MLLYGNILAQPSGPGRKKVRIPRIDALCIDHAKLLTQPYRARPLVIDRYNFSLTKS